MVSVVDAETSLSKDAMKCVAQNAETLKSVRLHQTMEKLKFNCRGLRDMKLSIVKKADKELKIELEGADHGLCNLLQKKLLEEKDVDMGGYDVPHPLASNPIIYVRTKGATKPEEALIRAAEKAREANEAFGEALTKALKTSPSS